MARDWFDAAADQDVAIERGADATTPWPGS
jgi:hypothetical protein